MFMTMDSLPIIRRRFSEEVKELEHPMTLEKAEKTEVLYYNKVRTLGWIVKHHPRHLEKLMASEDWEPGSRAFWALTLVYNHYESMIRGLTNTKHASADIKLKGGRDNVGW